MPLSLTPQERSQRARIGAHALHAQHDSRVTSKPGRDAWLAGFEKQVDPDGVLSPEERARRAGHARQSYMAKLALRSARARRKRGGA